jgi:hypothetical protein
MPVFRDPRPLLKGVSLHSLSPFEGKLVNFRGNMYPIMAIITGQAKTITGLGHGLHHPFQAEVSQAVQADELANFLH